MGVISMSSRQAQEKAESADFAGSLRARGERLSALVDGELPEGGCLVDALAGLGEEDRAAWSRYHLIGDVLRSDDLALAPAKSAAFLAKFAARLQAEPHLLAPAAMSTLMARTVAVLRRAAPTLAVAASAAALTWILAPQLHGMGGLQGGARAASTVAHDGAMQRAALQATAQNGNLIRDARLDAYLEAHQQFGQQPGMQDVAPYIQASAFSSRVQQN